MRSLLLPLMAIALSACAGGALSGDPVTTSGSRSDVLTATELASRTGSAMDAIRALRPRFVRSGPSGTAPVVYLNGVRLETAQLLNALRASDVAEVRFLRGIDAVTRYGGGHSDGAILLRLHDGGVRGR